MEQVYSGIYEFVKTEGRHDATLLSLIMKSSS